MRKFYDWDLTPLTGETLTLTQCDERTPQGEFFTRYILHSPIKGVLLNIKISDSINHSFIAW